MEGLGGSKFDFEIEIEIFGFSPGFYLHLATVFTIYRGTVPGHFPDPGGRPRVGTAGTPSSW